MKESAMRSRNKLTVRVTARVEVPSSDGLECCIDALLASLVSMLDEPRGEHLDVGFPSESSPSGHGTSIRKAFKKGEGYGQEQ